MPLHYIVYTSVAEKPFTPAELEQILVRARAKNHTLRVTGMLLYSAGQILQVLEGPPDAIEQLYATIANDLRHRHVLTVAEGASERRLFPDWSMGFGEASAPEFARLAGYVDSSRTTFLLPRAHNLPVELRDMLMRFVSKPDAA
ncbi:BLUF domain-containing protein [Hymenobacter aerilatus]|uniref:BLUF domain-containing protein n=1 Tax=Hymenobacter aerilatus TaxID=2932251 RepID=A0A8T9T257_9BACT|nr:BLUF domain-containing protein [Hymenobacter aerilatus]UOR06186.1 BLUF domain-containing protein [Hymenobacter aerilatus]